MAAILIKSNSPSNLQLLSELVKKLGDTVIELNADELEDLALGSLMQKARTGKNVSRNSVMKKLTL